MSNTNTRGRLATWGVRALGVAALFALVVASASPVAAQEVKIAVVDLDFIVAQSPAGQQLGAQLEQFQQTVQAEIEAKTEAARAIRQRMTEGANSLSEDKLAELQKELEDAGIEIRRFRDDKQREGEKMQAEGLRGIEQQLEPVFTAVRDEGGYDIILNNVPGVVVMTSESVNITQQILDRLNAGGGS